MSQDGLDHQEITTATTNTSPMTNPNSKNYDDGEDNSGAQSKTASPVDARSKRNDVVEEEGERGPGGASRSSSRSSSDGAANDVAASGSGAVKGRRGRRDGAEHEMHIWTERERRKRMRSMFSNLHALLPHLPVKSDKASIVGEAISQIKTLEATLLGLQKRKQELVRAQRANAQASSSAQPPRPAQVVAPAQPALQAAVAHGWSSLAAVEPNAAAAAMLPPAGAVTAAPPRFKTWSTPNIVLNVAGDDAYINVCAPRQAGILTTVLMVMEKHRIEVVTAQVSSDRSRSMFMIHARANGGPSQLSDNLTSEEIYKLAMSEMMLWLSN